jgi:hypothetical protein
VNEPARQPVAQIPPYVDPQDPEGHLPTSRPQIRRQVERICDSLGVEFDAVTELTIEPGIATVVFRLRNEDGEFYLNEFGKPALNIIRVPVDTVTFLGDEKDF